MKNEELIYDLLDGALASEKEKELFLELATNEALREELRNQLKIQGAIKSDFRAFTPKPETTAALFASLGFATVATPTFAQRIAQYGAAYKQGIFSALATAGLAVIAYLLFFTPEAVDADRSMTLHSLPTVKSTEIVSEDDSMLSQMSAVEEPQVKVVYKYIPVYIEKAEVLTENENENESRLLTVNQADKLVDNNWQRNDLTDLVHLSDNKLNSANIIVPVALPFNSMNSIVETNGKVKFEMHGSEYFNIDGGSALPGAFQKFNNTNLTLLYIINDNWEIGTELRRENFYQSFISEDSEDLVWRYEQQPNFNTLGLAIRYKYNQLDFRGKPVAQLVLGGNEVGFVGRGLIGFDFNLNNNLSFILGADYSLLRYNHQSVWYNSSKYGLHFGIGVKF